MTSLVLGVILGGLVATQTKNERGALWSTHSGLENPMKASGKRADGATLPALGYNPAGITVGPRSGARPIFVTPDDGAVNVKSAD
jgi:hypothetical protein